MGIVIVTDVFCDSCAGWGNHSTGDAPDKRGALASAKAAGWEVVTLENGIKELHCPECLGKTQGFWARWFKGNRGVSVRFD